MASFREEPCGGGSSPIDKLQFNATKASTPQSSPTEEESKFLITPTKKSPPILIRPNTLNIPITNKMSDKIEDIEACDITKNKHKNQNQNKTSPDQSTRTRKIGVTSSSATSGASPSKKSSSSEDSNEPAIANVNVNASCKLPMISPQEMQMLNSHSNSRIAKMGIELPGLYLPTQQSFVYLNHNSPALLRRQQGSFKFYKPQDFTPPGSDANAAFSDSGSQISKLYSDAISTRSWTSVGMGSTDGKKMIVRRVPTTPVELFNIVNPPTPPEEYLYESDDGSDVDSTDYLKPRRQQWSNKFQFVLACIGYSVGIGSVWRFPYMCYKSEGGVFLIPYFIIMIICGIPMLYMELTVGQYTGRGPIGAIGHLCPLLKGTGLASVIISFLMSTYYSVIIAYGIYYFFTSFKPLHPWAECKNKTDSGRCWEVHSSRYMSPNHSQTLAEQFYESKVLKMSGGIENFGYLRWELVACLLCAWILVYFAIWKSIKSSAKVRYFTATVPFLLIIVFLVKSVTLEGAEKGLQYFFRPKWELLLDANVWVNALAQNLNSMGLSYGSMMSFASYNKFNNGILSDTIAVASANAITSIIVGIFTFATLGNIASEQHTEIDNVVADGPGLIFVVYPQAIGKMPAAHLWAVLFFFMLLCLVLNSQFAIVEVVVTSMQDGFPQWIKKRLGCHEMLVLVVCAISFLCGLPNVTNGGIYFFQLIDHYTASISIMFLAFLEIIAIGWFYGVWRLCKNVEAMNAKSPSLYFKFCWMIAAPFLIFSIWIFYLVDYEPPTYNNKTYHYPKWAVALGGCIASASILAVPIFSIFVIMKSKEKTLWEKIKSSLQPDLYECEKCGQHFCEHLDNIDEENEPMLILRTADLGNHNLTPNYTPVTNSPIVNRTNIPQTPSEIQNTGNTNENTSNTSTHSNSNASNTNTDVEEPKEPKE